MIGWVKFVYGAVFYPLSEIAKKIHGVLEQYNLVDEAKKGSLVI